MIRLLAPRLPRRRKRLVAARENLSRPAWAHLFTNRYLNLINIGALAFFVYRLISRNSHLYEIDQSASYVALFSTYYQQLSLIGMGLLGVIVVWWLPKIQASRSRGVNGKNLFDRENKARKTLAQFVGHILILAGIYSSITSFNLQREAQITDRLTKAVEKLSATTPGVGASNSNRPRINLVVRLGAIHELERIAQESPKDHTTIMELLSAFVRENLDDNASDTLEGDARRKIQVGASAILRPDLQAALNVIGRRDTKYDPFRYRLNLRGAKMEGANLNQANLNSASLSNAVLTDSSFESANLAEASFFGAKLDHADFVGADLEGAFLVDAKLSGAAFSGAKLDGADFSGSNLEGADLRAANLAGAQNLTVGQINSAIGNADTKLPPYLTADRPASWND